MDFFLRRLLTSADRQMRLGAADESTARAM
jgi:hypothetical protein